MSLSHQIADVLAESTFPGTVSAQEPPHRLQLTCRSANTIGIEADHLDFSADDPGAPDRPIDELRAWADRLAERVTYLMEPLVLVEVDPEGGVVELRSDKPTPRPGLRSYYEVRLDRRTRLRLHRVAFDEAQKRRRETSFQLTAEVLERLVDDLVATAPH